MNEESARKDLPSELSNSKDHALLPSIEFSLDNFISTPIMQQQPPIYEVLATPNIRYAEFDYYYTITAYKLQLQ
jgi:hypothetical protein